MTQNADDTTQVDAAVSAAVTDAIRELRSELEKDKPRVGRTPSDAATEITGSLFTLLGQWTGPILLIILLAVGWYYLQEQNQEKDNDYRESLATLRTERDKAYERISEFNLQVATVSGEQITNLRDAFASLKEINTESAERQQALFLLQDEADEAVAERLAAQQQLQEANREIGSRQAELEKSRKELDKTRDELIEREEEVERKERDLTQRGGRIGELQDHLRNLQMTSESYIQALKDMNEELAEEETDPVRLGNLQIDADVGKARYEEAAQTVVDMTVDIPAILALLKKYEDWGVPGNIAERLVGVSETRFTELLRENVGFGFDFWLGWATEGDKSLIGVAIEEPYRFRWLYLSLSEGEDGDTRIVETNAGEALFPVIAPASDDAWSNRAYLVTFEDGSIDNFDAEWNGETDATSVPIGVLLELEEQVTAWLAEGDSDAIPVMTREVYEQLLASRTLPIDAERQLQGDDGMGLLFSMNAERAAGALNALKALENIREAGLRAAVEPILERARLGALDPRDATASAALGVTAETLGRLAFLALQPSFRFEVEVNPVPASCIGDDSAQNVVPQSTREMEPAHFCTRFATVLALGDSWWSDVTLNFRQTEYAQGRWQFEERERATLE